MKVKGSAAFIMQHVHLLRPVSKSSSTLFVSTYVIDRINAKYVFRRIVFRNIVLSDDNTEYDEVESFKP